MQETFVLKQSGARLKKAAEAPTARLLCGTALLLIHSRSYSCVTVSQQENYPLQLLCSSLFPICISPLPQCSASFSFPLAIPSLCTN